MLFPVYLLTSLIDLVNSTQKNFLFWLSMCTEPIVLSLISSISHCPSSISSLTCTPISICQGCSRQVTCRVGHLPGVLVKTCGALRVIRGVKIWMLWMSVISLFAPSVIVLPTDFPLLLMTLMWSRRPCGVHLFLLLTLNAFQILPWKRQFPKPRRPCFPEAASTDSRI